MQARQRFLRATKLLANRVYRETGVRIVVPETDDYVEVHDRVMQQLVALHKSRCRNQGNLRIA